MASTFWRTGDNVLILRILYSFKPYTYSSIRVATNGHFVHTADIIIYVVKPIRPPAMPS